MIMDLTLLEIILLVIMLFLAVYVIVLHVMLAKKNQFIEKSLGELVLNDNKLDKDYILRFLKDLKNMNMSNMMRSERLLQKEIQEFLFNQDNRSYIFIHYTSNESIARRIMSEGFMFIDSFHKTAEMISEDKVALVYKHNLNKFFGKFIVVLGITRENYEYFVEKLEDINDTKVLVEHVLVEKPALENEDHDHVYTLPNKFVKGYINYETGEIVQNPDYEPDYRSPRFEENVEILKNA